MDSLSWLEEWYLYNCDGDWEHTYGVTIGTLDNPGWSVDIDLIDTDLEGIDFKAVDNTKRSEDDWLFCKVEDNVFRGCGGPRNLYEIIGIFRDWVEANCGLGR
jgi:hypothetical protein